MRLYIFTTKLKHNYLRLYDILNIILFIFYPICFFLVSRVYPVTFYNLRLSITLFFLGWGENESPGTAANNDPTVSATKVDKSVNF